MSLRPLRGSWISGHSTEVITNKVVSPDLSADLLSRDLILSPSDETLRKQVQVAHCLFPNACITLAAASLLFSHLQAHLLVHYSLLAISVHQCVKSVCRKAKVSTKSRSGILAENASIATERWTSPRGAASNRRLWHASTLHATSLFNLGKHQLKIGRG